MIISARCASSCTTHSRPKDFIKTLNPYRGANSTCIAHARRQNVACVAQVLKELPQADKLHDDTLSRRDLELDQMGYFIILLDRENSAIVVDHYKNTINEQGECNSWGNFTQRCTQMFSIWHHSKYLTYLLIVINFIFRCFDRVGLRWDDWWSDFLCWVSKKTQQEL